MQTQLKSLFWRNSDLSLSKTFDTINHSLFIVHGFSMASHMVSVKTLVHLLLKRGNGSLRHLSSLILNTVSLSRYFTAKKQIKQ